MIELKQSLKRNMEQDIAEMTDENQIAAAMQFKDDLLSDQFFLQTKIELETFVEILKAAQTVSEESSEVEEPEPVVEVKKEKKKKNKQDKKAREFNENKIREPGEDKPRSKKHVDEVAQTPATAESNNTT
jgi:hypothetical protein